MQYQDFLKPYQTAEIIRRINWYDDLIDKATDCERILSLQANQQVLIDDLLNNEIVY